MIKTEILLIRTDGKTIYRHFSDDNKYIIDLKDNLIYGVIENTDEDSTRYKEGNYFEWYIDQQLLEKYPDEKIEQSISKITTSTTDASRFEELNITDSILIQ